MDANAFLSFDLREIAEGKVEESALEGIDGLRKSHFDPENIGAEAKRKLIFRSIVHYIETMHVAPNEGFTRMVLQEIGVKHVRAKALGEYHDLVKSAFSEFVNLQILKRLDIPREEKVDKIPAPLDSESRAPAEPREARIVTTEKEMEIFYYTRRRLAFLLEDDAAFKEIDNIQFRDYVGKFVVFYKKERKGRLFEFEEGDGDTGHQFRFADGTEVRTSKLEDLDEHLLAGFRRRVTEMA